MSKSMGVRKTFTEIKKRYKGEHLNFDEKQFYQVVGDWYQQANENYLKLSDPKTCNSDLYADVWVWQEVIEYVARKNIGKPFDLDSPPFEFKASADFYKNYPLGNIRKMKNLAGDVFLEEMDKKFMAMVEERNNFSKDKGYGSRVEMALKNYRIPKLEYKKFLTRVDKVILRYKRKLSNDSKQKGRCLICESEIPMSLKEILTFFKKKNSALDVAKINIVMGDFSETKYQKLRDSFEISLDKTAKINHQKLELIHEIAHVLSFLDSFSKDCNPYKKGRYFREKSAVEIEVMFLKKYYPKLLLAKVENILYNLSQTLFEIELYDKPARDQGEVYARCLNKCFVDSKIKYCKDYLFSEEIVYNSFLYLPYAVAYVNVLSKPGLGSE